MSVVGRGGWGRRAGSPGPVRKQAGRVGEDGRGRAGGAGRAGQQCSSVSPRERGRERREGREGREERECRRRRATASLLHCPTPPTASPRLFPHAFPCPHAFPLPTHPCQVRKKRFNKLQEERGHWAGKKAQRKSGNERAKKKPRKAKH